MAGSTPKYGEVKKPRSVYITDESWQKVDKIAGEFFISRSELLELIGQGRLKVIRQE